MERIVEATNPTVIAACENKIAKLEREKLVLEEKRLTSGNPRGRFEDMFELAMRFLASPSKLWVSGSHAHRRLVLKLTFADRLSYCRKLGFRTPETTLPFKALVSFHEGQSAMAERVGFEPTWGCPPSDFESAPLWPLRYLSAEVVYLNLSRRWRQARPP